MLWLRLGRDNWPRLFHIRWHVHCGCFSSYHLVGHGLRVGLPSWPAGSAGCNSTQRWIITYYEYDIWYIYIYITLVMLYIFVYPPKNTVTSTALPRYDLRSALYAIGKWLFAQVMPKHSGPNLFIRCLGSGHRSSNNTLSLFNIAMENGPFIDGLPWKIIIYGEFSHEKWWFSMAMLVIARWYPKITCLT